MAKVINSVAQSGECEVGEIAENEILERAIFDEVCRSETQMALHGLDFEVSGNKALDRAVWALSRNGHPGVEINFGGGQKRKTYSFLAHPDFREHFRVLQKHWGQMPPETTERKSFEVIKWTRDNAIKWQKYREAYQALDPEKKRQAFYQILDSIESYWREKILADETFDSRIEKTLKWMRQVRLSLTNKEERDLQLDQKISFQGKSLAEWRSENISDTQITSFFEIYFRTPEISWSRDGKNSLFKVGYAHNAAFQYLRHQDFMQVAPHIDLAGIETYHGQFGSVLQKRADEIRDKNYSGLMRDLYQQNNEIVFLQFDNRNPISHYFDSENFDREFYQNYFDYLQKIHPRWASEKIGSAQTWQQIVEFYQHPNRSQKSMSSKAKYLYYTQWPHLKRGKNGNLVPSAKPWGRQAGAMEFTDAVAMQHWLELSHSIQTGSNFPPQIQKEIDANPEFAEKTQEFQKRGAVIFEVEGYAHNPQKDFYEINAFERHRLIATHPHYLGWREHSQRTDEITPEHSSGFFDLDYLNHFEAFSNFPMLNVRQNPEWNLKVWVP